MAKMPIVTPSRDKKVRSKLANRAFQAKLKLSRMSRIMITGQGFEVGLFNNFFAKLNELFTNFALLFKRQLPLVKVKSYWFHQKNENQTTNGFNVDKPMRFQLRNSKIRR